MSELESSVTPLLSQADAEREFGAGSPLAELVGDFLIDGLRDRIHELERERDEARDGDPFDYGEGAAYPNPYGFVPAVWVKHTDIGSGLRPAGHPRHAW